MPLRSVGVQRSYRTGEADIASQFLIPCLEQASTYDRATGYFSGNVLVRLLRGLKPFVLNKGRFRIVASPILSQDDIDQLTRGYADRDTVILRRIDDVLEDFADADPTRFAQLSWLVANGLLDIRLAIPAQLRMPGIYHEKFGLFRDLTDEIAFCGSLNETLAALDGNFEYIDVFSSWSEPSRVSEKRSYFEKLWTQQTEGLDVLEFPRAALERLLKVAPREYPADEPERPEDAKPTRKLLPHQLAALSAWEKNGRRGVLDMATGTGKTFTALSAARAMLDRSDIKSLVILAPYIAIAEQWRDEAERIFGAEPIVCHSQTDWRGTLPMMLALAQYDPKPILIIALNDTAASDDFRNALNSLPKPRLLIADEVHNITVDDAGRLLWDGYDFRLALSATPRRYLDSIGTERIERYFGGIVFQYTLHEAIRDGILVPYDYFPIICEPLTITRYPELSDVNASKLEQFEQTYMSTPAAVAGFTLVYCQPQQLPHARSFLGTSLQQAIHTFTALEDMAARRTILHDFGEGRLKVLVAIRCLDEGVDVPPTRSAFLLGSSENPKQFVQRRGRVLRQYPGKESAAIYDYLFLPKPKTQTQAAALEKEMSRFGEFSLSARNADNAMQVLSNAGRHRGISLSDYSLSPV
jgi:superfamily II DNA or RNA helicase